MGRDLGQAPGLAAATGAYLCFEDEAGQSLRPPKARTWGRRGHTPVTVVSGKGSGRVPAAGMTCYRPGARSRFFYRIRVHAGRKGERRFLSEADYADLVTAAHQQLHAPVILCWDNLNTHIGGRDARLHPGAPRLADRRPDARLRAGPEPSRGCLVHHEEQPGQPGLLQHAPGSWP